LTGKVAGLQHSKQWCKSSKLSFVV
jgi:hypothetical protein